MAVLKFGSRGKEVRRLTQLLVDRGHLKGATSQFGKGVKVAVLRFQAGHVDSRGHPLVADGVVGPLTWWALEHPDNTALLSTPPPAEALQIPPGGTPAGRAALKAAISEMQAGAREIGADNSGSWVDKYLNRVVATPNNWCAGFVSWCCSQIPGGIPFRYSVGARDIREQFQKRGWGYDSRQRTPEPGDIIVWWRGQPDGWMGHIGFVHHVADGILFTIEGNKGGFPAPVRQFNYVLSRIDKLLGFGQVP
jgi:hypothetical protein